jgi:hypothetical protein
MTPRPFYRSTLFWLGLPGLLFLLWAWWVSYGHTSWAGFMGPRPWWIGQAAGEVVAAWNRRGSPELWNFAADYLEIPVSNPPGWHRWPREPIFRPGFRCVVIPYYAVILAYVTTWLLTLAWWQRRKSRLMKLHPAP